MRPLLGVIDFLCMQGYRKNAGMNYNATALANAITEYDAATSAYRAFVRAHRYTSNTANCLFANALRANARKTQQRH
eukprot:m.786256 g.786256  ORF g.786256 m.786256 type:complete len:77 (-) comp23305_c1_seq18:303-533(-)